MILFVVHYAMRKYGIRGSTLIWTTTAKIHHQLIVPRKLGQRSWHVPVWLNWRGRTSMYYQMFHGAIFGTELPVERNPPMKMMKTKIIPFQKLPMERWKTSNSRICSVNMGSQSQGIGLFGNNGINSTLYNPCLIVSLFISVHRWVVLYNANLDRSPHNRKTIVELKKDLKRWEEERPKKKKLVVNDVLGYQVYILHHFFRICLLLTKRFYRIR